MGTESTNEREPRYGIGHPDGRQRAKELAKRSLSNAEVFSWLACEFRHEVRRVRQC